VSEPRSRSLRPGLTISLGLIAFGAAGFLLERATWFDPIREVMQAPAVPARTLEIGELGQILRGQDIVYSTRTPVTDRWRLHQQRAVLRFNPDHSTPPPSESLAADHLVGSWPLICLSVEEPDLYGADRGILANWREKWERPAHVSYFVGAEHVFSGYCGVRLHGDSTRLPRIWYQIGPSFRLHFREEYGTDRFAPGTLFGPECEPVQRLIIRADSPFNSAIGFDIVRRLGGDAPAMQPGLFVLNGEAPRIRSFCEQLSRRMWSARLGHENFYFHRNRSPDTPADHEAYTQLRAWASSLEPGELTIERAESRVDVEHLTQHLFSIIWCGTDDWAQGAAVLDRTEENPRWRWVNWDMDRSFRHSSSGERGLVWEKDALDLILGEKELPPEVAGHRLVERRLQTGSVRGLVFKRLLRDDPAYRTFFVDRATGWMNHELAPAFLEERLQHYSAFADPRFTGDPEEFTRLVYFFRFRSDVVREDLSSTLDLGPPIRCEVAAPEGATLLIDGRRCDPPYVGWYFAGQTIEVEAAEPDETSLRGWRVNGEEHDGARLRLPVRGELTIEGLAR